MTEFHRHSTNECSSRLTFRLHGLAQDCHALPFRFPLLADQLVAISCDYFSSDLHPASTGSPRYQCMSPCKETEINLLCSAGTPFRIWRGNPVFRILCFPVYIQRDAQSSPLRGL